jgi:aldose 1-epimerase
MSFRVRQTQQPNTMNLDPAVWLLDDGRGNELRVWPALGFNAYHWSADGRELLYRDPALFDGAKPTRSGFPILFPFPNRIRAGSFTWQGRTYQLPLNDPAGKNAIHGFVAYRPWRVTKHGGDEKHAWLTAVFDSREHAAEARELWPADYELVVTYRLGTNRLRVDAAVTSPGTEPLPFGLGYHPYFRVQPFGDGAARVTLFARQQWELHESLPTGRKDSVRPPIREVRFADLHLDDLYTDLEGGDERAADCAAISPGRGGVGFVMSASRGFGELVAFTPPHRQAICFEPYTCITDAINLQPRGVDAGLRVLEPGGRWQGWVEMALIDSSRASRLPELRELEATASFDEDRAHSEDGGVAVAEPV